MQNDQIYEIDITPILNFFKKLAVPGAIVGLILVILGVVYFFLRPKLYESVSYISLPYMPIVSVTDSGSVAVTPQYAVNPKVAVNYINEVAKSICVNKQNFECSIDAVLVNRNEYPIRVEITAKTPETAIAKHKYVLEMLNSLSGITTYKKSIIFDLQEAIARLDRAIRQNPALKADAQIIQELNRYSTIKSAIEKYGFYFVVEPQTIVE